MLPLKSCERAPFLIPAPCPLPPPQAVNWSKLEARQVEASFKPAVHSSLSVENFDAMWTEQAAEDSPCATPKDDAWAKAFEGFTYVAPSFLAKGVPPRAAV